MGERGTLDEQKIIWEEGVLKCTPEEILGKNGFGTNFR